MIDSAYGTVFKAISAVKAMFLIYIINIAFINTLLGTDALAGAAGDTFPAYNKALFLNLIAA